MRDIALIVDNESHIREILAQLLSEHYQVILAKTAEEVVDLVLRVRPVIIVMEVKIGMVCGLEICKILRKDRRTKNIPIIMLASQDQADTKIKAFEAGADDYLIKPFVHEELRARVAAKVRRAQERQEDSVQKNECQIEFENLKLDFELRQIEISGIPVELGNVELRILHYLLKNIAQLISREALNTYVWGDKLHSERALDPHINSLRKKLKVLPIQLKTFYGRGFCLNHLQ
jgi:DNA-binding response OmpR family regulator